ncbi:uncharacterized protein LOC132842613 [Tachysurus vachellii]|uniref:uncharacterized protein LOC132842613 n=1 Tax=Tachysurus vachellii TaxID=175792 RepID=UPI00296B1DE4|nr:uncharacterized protein LOC132842613 [Tachysurus vachellii]
MTDIIIINLICQAIFSGNGYTYPVSPNISSAVLQDPDCEKAWYRKAPGNGSELEFLSDGQLHGNQSKLVVDVSEKNITITKCIELLHDVTCHGSNQKFQHLYQVTDRNATNPTIKITTTTTTIIIVVIIIIIIIIGIGVLVSLRSCCEQTEEQNNEGRHSKSSLHLSLSSASSTLAPTSFKSSFITSIYLLFGLPLCLLPGSSMSNILLPIYSLSLL